jgi:hypothetical protein
MVSRTSLVRSACVAVLLITGSRPVTAQGPGADPSIEIRSLVAGGRYDRASGLVAEWIRSSPDDLDARAWHARILSWTNRWAEAEAEYRSLLARSPRDVDLLAGLADVLAWQGHPDQALPLLEEARTLDRRRADVELRRARVLQQLGRDADARGAYQQALRLDPGSADARRGLDQLRETARHQVTFGSAFDNLDYADNGGSFEAALDSRWTARWSTRGSIAQYSRYGEPATRIAAAGTLRLHGSRWLTAGAAAAGDNPIIPRGELQAEFGQAFRLGSASPLIRGVETTFQSLGQWYRDVSVLRLTPGAIVYLPREWNVLVRVSATRVAGSGTGSSWEASGWTRLSFPMAGRVAGFVLAGVGNEGSVYLDQVLAASSRTFGGGLRLRVAPGRELTLLVQRQAWSGGRAQTSVGASYGLRF